MYGSSWWISGHLTRKPYGCFKCPGNKINAVLMWFVFCGMICCLFIAVPKETDTNTDWRCMAVVGGSHSWTTQNVTGLKHSLNTSWTGPCKVLRRSPKTFSIGKARLTQRALTVCIRLACWLTSPNNTQNMRQNIYRYIDSAVITVNIRLPL